MDEDKDAYYVVQKGDVIGFYKSLKECQAQAGCSVFGSDATVYKAYNLSKEAEQYLASHGLQNATYSISADNVTNDLFGQLLSCPYQQPSASREKMTEEYFEAKKPRQQPSDSREEMTEEYSEAKRPREVYYMGTVFTLTNSTESQYNVDSNVSYVLQFDGASKGNPGLAGAGAVMHAQDGSLVCRLQEGVGIATNNVAEYRALILGLKHALKHGIKHISVQGDSKLVCMQLQGLWKIKNKNMADLCKVAKELKDKFISFEINHVPRLDHLLVANLNFKEHNSNADALANRGIYLRDGEVVEDCKPK